MKGIAKVLLLASTVYAVGAWSSTSQTVDDVCRGNFNDCRILFDNYFTELYDENSKNPEGAFKEKIRELKEQFQNTTNLLEERKQKAFILVKAEVERSVFEIVYDYFKFSWDYFRSFFWQIYYTMLSYIWPYGNSYESVSLESIEVALNNADPEITSLENQVTMLKRKVAIAELVLSSLPAIENNKFLTKIGSSWYFINAEINNNQELEAFALLLKWLDVASANFDFSKNLASNFAENSLHKIQLAIKESYLLTKLHLRISDNDLHSQKFSAALFNADFAFDLAKKSRVSSSNHAKLKKLDIDGIYRPEVFLSNMMPFYDVNNWFSAKFDTFNLGSETPLTNEAVLALKKLLEGGLKDLYLDVEFDSQASENLQELFNFNGRPSDLGNLTLVGMDGMDNGDIAKIISSLVDYDNNLKLLFLTNLKQDNKGDKLMYQLARAYNQVDSKFKLNALYINSDPLNGPGLQAEEFFFQSFANSQLASGIDRLLMTHQGLKDIHIQHLASSMTNGMFCPIALDLTGNTISDTGVSYLLEAFHHCPRLQSLRLAYNDQITSDGVSAINSYFLNHSVSELEVTIDYQQTLRLGANWHTNTAEMQDILNNSSHFSVLQKP